MLSDKLDSTSKQNWQTKMERIETKKLETRSKKIATIWKILPNFFLSKRKWKSLFALSTSLHLAKLQLFKLDIKMKKTYFFGGKTPLNWFYFHLFKIFFCTFHNMFKTRHTLYLWLHRYQWKKFAFVKTV